MLVHMCGTTNCLNTIVQIMKKVLNQSIPIEQTTAAEQQPSNSPSTGWQQPSKAKKQPSDRQATAQQQGITSRGTGWLQI
jgi:hypothetical protein